MLCFLSSKSRKLEVEINPLSNGRSEFVDWYAVVLISNRHVSPASSVNSRLFLRSHLPHLNSATLSASSDSQLDVRHEPGEKAL